MQALTNVTFAVERGEYVAIMGESGSGKTTLLNILAALDRPTEGEVFLNGRALSTIGEKEIASFRRQNLGFVFQDFNLLDTFTLQDNIFLPLVLAGKHFPEMQAKLLPLAQQLGIADLLQKYPYEVSGGQKQRAAVARALITSPQILLADEPTGALDSRASDSLLSLFGEINRAGQTILMVTHSTKAASHAGRVPHAHPECRDCWAYRSPSDAAVCGERHGKKRICFSHLRHGNRDGPHRERSGFSLRGAAV